MNKRRAILLAIPAAVIGIYFAFGYWMAYYFPVSSSNEVFQLVNSATGPFSGLVISNYIYDGFSNVIVFAIFLGIFIVVNLLTDIKILRGRTLFLLAGMFVAPLIPEVIGRIYLTPTIVVTGSLTVIIRNIAYGQSGVLAAAMGIIFSFTILTIVKGQWVHQMSFLGGLTYGIILGILTSIEFVLFQGLFAVVWAVEVVHLGSLALGVILSFLYWWLSERPRRTERVAAILIPESKVRA